MHPSGCTDLSQWRLVCCVSEDVTRLDCSSHTVQGSFCADAWRGWAGFLSWSEANLEHYLLLNNAWKTSKMLTGVSYSLDTFSAYLLTAQSTLLGVPIKPLLFIAANTSPAVQDVCSLLVSHLPSCQLKAKREKGKEAWGVGIRRYL